MFEGDPGEGPSYAGFKVNEAGRQRVIREGRKNVHAYAWGYYPEFDEENIKWQMEFDKVHLQQATYNPYLHGCFTLVDSGAAVGYARRIFFTPQGLFLVRPRV
jgi:hypothetical protein